MITEADFWNPTFMEDLVQAGMIVPTSESYSLFSQLWDRITFWIVILMIVGLGIDALNGFLRAGIKTKGDSSLPDRS